MFLHTPKIVILFLLILVTAGTWAQTEKKVRPKESDVLLEKLFIEATREKILQNYDEAIRKYLEVLQKDNNNSTANYELARLYERQKQLDKAVMRAERAVEIEPDNLLYNELLAQILEKSGNYKRAAELFEYLSGKYPDKYYLYYEWAYYLTKNKKEDLAIKVYNSLEKRTGIKEPISMRKYKLYMRLNKAKKAGQELEKLIKEYPDEPEFMLRLANFYAVTKQFEKAKEWYTKTLDLDPNNPTANVAMVEYFLQNGDTAKYLNALAPIFEDPKQDIAAKLKTIQPLASGLAEGQYLPYKESIEKLTANLVDAHPSNPQANLIRGQLLFDKKKYKRALEHYKVSFSQNKNNVQVWERLLECLHQSNNNNELFDLSTEMVDLYPSQPFGYYYNGIALISSQKYEKAREQLLSAVDIAITNKVLQGKALGYLGKAYALLENFEKAEKVFKEAILNAPDNDEVKHNQAYSLAVKGSDLDKASKLVEEALKVNAENPNYITTKGLILYKQAKYSLAQQTLDKAISFGGSEIPETLERYGDTMFKLNKTEEAVKYWQKAANKGASSEVLKRKIATKQLYE